MSSVQPITIDEQDHYLATRQVTRGVTHAPKRHKALKASKPAVERALATFGQPDNLPGFKYAIGSQVHTTNGSKAWTVVAQAETPAGTSSRSYRIVSGKMEKVVGENALKAQEAPKKMTVIDVRLNKATGQIEPVPQTTLARTKIALNEKIAQNARSELKSMLVASVAPTLAPAIDEPALHTVEPMACHFTSVTGWKQVRGRTSSHRVPSARSTPMAPTTQAVRKNAPFAPTAVITVLATKNPKKPGSKSHERFALYVSGQTVTQAISLGVLMIDVKWDAEHGFIRVE